MTTDPLSKSRDPLIGTRVDGRYLVKSVLGRGGMGVVYEGVHEQLGRPVAIKVLGAGISGDPVSVQRFLREAQTASQLTHGNIVDVSDLGVLDDGRPYLVMARVQGTDLATLLKQHGPQPPRRVVEFLRGVASALDLVHAKGFVHRDVKPENLMHVVREDGSETTLLLDFGIVGLVSNQAARLTAEGSVFGTPAYLPPEVIQGAMPDRRADVYALATVAFELMSGHAPFEADNPLRILPRKVMEDAPRMGDVCPIKFDPTVEAVIARGLTREPEPRWPSAGEFLTALDDAVYALETAAGTIEPRSRSKSMRRSGVGLGPSTGTRPLPNRAPPPPPPAAGGFDPVQAGTDREMQALLDSRQLEVALEASLPPIPQRPPPPGAAEQALTSRLDPVGSPTLSVELNTSDLEIPGRSKRSLWIGVAAGVGLVAMILIGRLAFRETPAEPSPNEIETVRADRPPPTASATPPQSKPEPEPEPAPTPPPPPPTAAVAVAAAKPKPKPTAAPVNPAPRPTKPEPRPASKAPPPITPEPAAIPTTTTTAKAPGKSSVSASELVQAAARELIQGHLNAAADLYAQAARLDPKNEPAFRGLGLANERLGRKNEAIRAFNRALALAPDGQNAAMVRARLAKLQGSQ